MEAIIHDTTVEITCTLEEVQGMASLGAAIYATPTPRGDAGEVYVSTHGHFKYDFVLATVEDFEAALGYDISPDDELDDEKGCVTITVPRTPHALEGG